MNENKNDVFKSINKCLSGISKDDVFSNKEEVNCKLHTPLICPECGEDSLALASSIHDEVVLWCTACNTPIPCKRKHVKDISNSEVNGLIKPVMEANNLNGPLSTIQFLVEHYNKTKNNSPGLMTINDADDYLYIKEYPNNPRGYEKAMTRVVITYMKAFNKDKPYVDSMEFNCSSMEDLRMQWNDFIVENGVYPDSIKSFDIDISFNYRQYLDRMISEISNIPRSVFIDDSLFEAVISTSTYEENVGDVMDILLSSRLFAPFRGKVVFPHIEKVKNPNSGKMVPCVLRYINEKGDDEE